MHLVFQSLGILCYKQIINFKVLLLYFICSLGVITECGDGMSTVDLGEYDLLHDADLDKV